MCPAESLTRREILSQPEVWADVLATLTDQASALRTFLTAHRYDTVLVTGCGSAYYLSLAAGAVLQTLMGVPARGLPSSEVWLHSASAYVPSQRMLLVAVSRSGETTETLRACETFLQHRQGDVLTLSCSPGAALTQLGTMNLVFPAAQEESIVQTRAFSALYLVVVAMAGLWSGREDLFASLARLPQLARHVLDTSGPLVRRLGENRSLDRFYFLGSGLRYGLACELSLKMKEMSLSHSEPFHFLEFRHGPRAMVTASTLVIGLVSREQYAREHTVLSEIRAQRGSILEIGDEGEDVSFQSMLDEVTHSVLFLPVGQLLALARATSKGLNPDRPHNLTAVIRLP